MRIDLLFPALPPALDGIGDYTANLAAHLSKDHEVRIWTAQANAAGIDRVEINQAFDSSSPRSIESVVEPLLASPPDWLVLQYNPFSYGKRGFNPSLPKILSRLREEGKLRLCLMIHEPFVPVENLKFGIMGTWQRWQLWRCGKQADAVFCSIRPWANHFQTWFPSTPVHFLPVGSNIPRIDERSAVMRRRLGIQPEDYVIGLFGTARGTRLLAHIKRGLDALASVPSRPKVLYIGPHGAPIKNFLSDHAVIDTGILSAADVSRHLSVINCCLAPFKRGVSSRRGSFMASIQHGIPTISTYGPHTDDVLRAGNGKAFMLTDEQSQEQFADRTVDLYRDAGLRKNLSQGGRTFFERNYSWDVICESMHEKLVNGNREKRGPA